ncbi:MAG TPA: hypothetical protein VGE52_10915, partial [Pirellulales bacterium]
LGLRRRQVMKTDLQVAMNSGVFVEFRDAQGDTLGRAVYADWHDRPLPNIGDVMCCTVPCSNSLAPRKLTGAVQTRQFDVQTDLDGDTCIWVYVIVCTEPTVASRPKSNAALNNTALGEFSAN